MEESGERVVDERLRAINKKTGKYVDLIKRTIYNDTPFPIVKYLNYSYDELKRSTFCKMVSKTILMQVDL